MSPQIAAHYERASLRDQAVAFYERASAVAERIGSHRDAAQYYSRALDLLDDLPETAGRDAQKQALLISLGLALRLTEGHAAEVVGEVFEKARVLNEKVGGAPQRFAVQRGLWSFYLLRAEYAVARNRAEELLVLAERLSDDALRLEALVALGLTSLWQGELIPACDYLERSLELYNQEEHGAHVVRYGQDPGVASHALLAYATCLLGQWDRSAGHLQAALSLAEQLEHPFSLSYALQHAMLVAHGERRSKKALVQAEKLLQLSGERGYAYWLGPGMIGQGWALSFEGQPARGLALIRQGLEAHRARGAGLSSTLWHGMLAEALIRTGKHAEALDLLDDTLDLAVKTGEDIWEAELYRMKGEAMIEIDGEAGAAEACFLQAIESARRQRTRMLELRAVVSLSRLRRRQGLAGQARAELQAVFDCFPEGIDRPDLNEARDLLDTWA